MITITVADNGSPSRAEADYFELSLPLPIDLTFEPHRSSSGEVPRTFVSAPLAKVWGVEAEEKGAWISTPVPPASRYQRYEGGTLGAMEHRASLTAGTVTADDALPYCMSIHADPGGSRWVAD